MASGRAELTELEGAVLSEIHDRGNSTAFKVRRAFQVSRSLEWSGSAGAVYPAIARLRAAGLIEAEAMPGGRNAMALRLSPAGVVAMRAWAIDAQRAASVGIDPLRLRSGIWRTLDKKTRCETLTRTADAIQKDLALILQELVELDEVEKTRVEMSVQLQRLRLSWIQSELDRS